MISEMMKSSIPRNAGSTRERAVGLGRAVMVVVVPVSDVGGGGGHY